MTRSAPALVLLAALLGGLGASSTHAVHHGAEWAESRSAHIAGGAHDADTDLLTVPCADGEAHGELCAVCSGFAGPALSAGAVVPAEPSPEQEVAAEVARVDHQRAVAPARGPPASVA